MVLEFEKKVTGTIEKYSMLSPGDTVVIGLSGGADSVALFNVLCFLRDKYSLNLHAAHINHMIRGNEAIRDADYARKIAEANGAEFHLLECDVPNLASEWGISEEMAGRQVRYDFFNEIVSDGGKIAVAHHKGDSAETTLINMIRGSSLNGLKGISPVNGNIIRPLIECERSEIEEYLKSTNTPFMTDSTNEQNIYTRNIVRNKLIPNMAQINPNIISTIYANSRLLGDDEDFISSVCRQYETDCVSSENGSVTLNLTNFADLHISVKRRLVMRCCEIVSGGRKGISSEHIDNILSLPTGGETAFCSIYVQRSYGKYIFSDSRETTSAFSYSISFPSEFLISETGKAYSFEIIPSENNSYENGIIYLDADKARNLTLRSRRDGDVFSPLGLGGRKKVKDYLIDNKIPRIEREKLPILESDGKIAAILCLRADEAYKVTPATQRILKIREVTES